MEYHPRNDSVAARRVPGPSMPHLSSRRGFCLFRDCLRLSVAWVSILLAIASTGFCQDTIVAVVNKDIITQRDLDEFIAFTRMQMPGESSSGEGQEKSGSVRKELLEKLIEDRLILQQARKSDVKVDEDRVKARLAEIKKRYGTDADFQTALRRQGDVESEVIARIREQFLMHAFVYEKVRSKVTISPSEVTQYYQAHRDQFREKGRTDMELFITDQYASALAIVEAIKKGSSLPSFADGEGVSQQTMSVEEGKLRGDIEAIVRDIPVGGICQPQAMDGKYYVFHVTARASPRDLQLSEASERVRNVLYEEKVEARLKTYLAEIKSRAYIKLY